MTKETVSNNVTPKDATKARRVKKWIDAKLKRASGRGVLGGLGSTFLALPALAQATDAELAEFQFAEAIPGVQSAKVLPNGDVQLVMTDGRTLRVAAENVQILDNGTVMIAEASALEIAELSAVAEAGAATAAASGISGVGLALGGLGLAGAAAAGGGGGGGGSDNDDDEKTESAPTAPRPPSLNLADLQAGALSNTSTNTTAPDGAATLDVTIGSVTKTVTPAPDGSWNVSLTQVEAAGLPQGTESVIVKSYDSGGLELASSVKEFFVDTIPPDIAVTTFSAGAVINAIEQGTDLRVSGTTSAESGQTVSVSVDGQTYTGIALNGAWSVDVPASDLATLSDGSVIAVTADVSDRAGNPAAQATASFQTDFDAPLLTLDPVAGGSIDLVDTTGDLVVTGTTTAEDGQVVSLWFGGQTYTGAASGGAWSVTIPNADLSGLSTGSPAAFSVSVSDAAGNPANNVNVSVPVDLTGPSVAIAPLSVGAVLNAAEAGSDLSVTGTTGNVSDGQIVTLSLDGKTYTGAVSGGNWSISIPAVDLAGLTDGGSFALTADVTDSDGLAAPQSSINFSKDASAPSLSIDGFSTGSIMNALEQAGDFTITGSTSAEDGQTVTVSMNGQVYSTSAVGGSWNVTVPASALSALSDGANISVLADVTDAAGNPAVQASGSFTTDFTAPSLTISSLSDGAVMNASEQATDLVIAGSSDGSDGTVVSVQIERPDGTIDVSGTTTVSGGSWSYTATASALSALADGETYSVVAAVSDTAGNNTSSTAGFQTDFTPPTVALNPLSIGSVLDIVERGVDLSVSGATTAEDGQSVTVSLNGLNYSTVVSSGTWSATIPTSDLAALADATQFTISASVEDDAGNMSSNATTTFTTDFTPILQISPIGMNSSVDLQNAQSSGITVSGSSSGLSSGQVVDILLNGSSVGSANVGSDGGWSLLVPNTAFASSAPGDALDFTVQATVSGGPDPAPAGEQVFAHTQAAYVIVEAGRSGSTITFEVYADSGRDISSGLAFDAELGFDPSIVTFDSGSEVENSDFDLFLTNQTGPDTIKFGGAATSYGDLSQPVVTFSMTIQTPGQPITLSIKTADGGPSKFHLGTTGADTLTGSNVDDVLRGGGGDDAIDVSGAGRDVVVIEADAAANGFDTITGFNLGQAANFSDALVFEGLNTSALRGHGTDIEVLSSGGTLGTDTGFVALSSVLSDLGDNAIATAAGALTGAQSGDELYLLATDGADSVLVKVDYSAPNVASVQKMARFDGLSDLNDLRADNILISDPTGATA